MLDWLNDIIRGLLAFVPRPSLIKKGYGGVLYKCATVKKLGPGLWWYWPIWSDIQTICIVRQTLNLPYQTLNTFDGEDVVIAVTVVYTIEDVELALTGTDNIVDTIQDISHSAVKNVVSNTNLEMIRKGRTVNNKSIDSLLRHKLQLDLSSYGVKIQKAFVAEFSKPYIVRLLGESN